MFRGRLLAVLLVHSSRVQVSMQHGPLHRGFSCTLEITNYSE